MLFDIISFVIGFGSLFGIAVAAYYSYKCYGILLKKYGEK